MTHHRFSRLVCAAQSAALAVLLSALPATPGCAKQRLSQRLHRQAQEAMHEGRIDDADAALERALRYDPGDPIALERLLALRLEHGRSDAAAALAARAPQVRSVRLANLILRAEVRGSSPRSWISRAAALARRGSLAADTERELLDVLGDAVQAAHDPSFLRELDLPERWTAQVVQRLVANGELASAAALVLQATPSPPSMHVLAAAKHGLLERLLAEGWLLEEDLLGRLTLSPHTPLEYLGRLELLLRSDREPEAARLEPPPALLETEWIVEWDLRWARHFARRGDWYGVLARTERRGRSPHGEATRHALRCAAHLGRSNLRSARAELFAWLGRPEAASRWGETLLLPELAPHASALAALRSEAEFETR
jgi:hypothetical protein